MLMRELATCVKYKLPIKLFVIKNDELGQIKWEQMVFLENPEYVTGLQPIDFGAVARAFGVTSYTGGGGWGDWECLGCAPGPFLIEAVMDANEPPLPARAKATQALHLAQSLAKGTKDWQKIAKTVAKDKIRELV
jgi:pyruvate dehydrogenase (quinone)/pyruvate oxidase